VNGGFLFMVLDGIVGLLSSILFFEEYIALLVLSSHYKCSNILPNYVCIVNPVRNDLANDTYYVENSHFRGKADGDHFKLFSLEKYVYGAYLYIILLIYFSS